MGRQRKIRDELRPPSEAVLLRAIYGAYRGGRLFDRQTLIEDVGHNFTEFDYFGLSLWIMSETCR